MRTSTIKRETKETKIDVFLDLDNSETEKNSIDTGCGFMDHMLDLFAAHGGFRLDIKCVGDTKVDYHHSLEDIGIALGTAFKEAIGDMRGIKRYSDIVLPMDEALVLVALDVSGRGYLAFDVDFPTEKVGDMDTELFKEFFIALTRKSDMTLHIKQLCGENTHHIAEAVFKAVGRTIAAAVKIDEDNKSKIPSTKGVLV